MALHLNVSVESFSKGRAEILGSEKVVTIAEPFRPRGVSFSDGGGGELRYARGARRMSCVTLKRGRIRIPSVEQSWGVSLRSSFDGR